MDEQMIAYFRNALNARLDEIVPRMSRRRTSMVESTSQKEPMDEIDQTLARYEHEFLLQMQVRNKLLINEIQEALNRIRKGSFGTCEECGRDIEVQRLMAQPMATLCIECKREWEATLRRKVA